MPEIQPPSGEWFIAVNSLWRLLPESEPHKCTVPRWGHGRFSRDPQQCSGQAIVGLGGSFYCSEHLESTGLWIEDGKVVMWDWPGSGTRFTPLASARDR
jgi:hypothetical protein